MTYMIPALVGFTVHCDDNKADLNYIHLLLVASVIWIVVIARSAPSASTASYSLVFPPWGLATYVQDQLCPTLWVWIRLV